MCLLFFTNQKQAEEDGEWLGSLGSMFDSVIKLDDCPLNHQSLTHFTLWIRGLILGVEEQDCAFITTPTSPHMLDGRVFTWIISVNMKLLLVHLITK